MNFRDQDILMMLHNTFLQIEFPGTFHRFLTWYNNVKSSWKIFANGFFVYFFHKHYRT